MGRFMNDVYVDSVPVSKIDVISDLVSMFESLATFNNSGYFMDLLNFLVIQNTERAYFQPEMNRQSCNQLMLITEMLQSFSGGDGYKALIAAYLSGQLEPLLSFTLDKRMVERANLFFGRNSLNALILLYEGIVISIGRKCGFNGYLDYDEREKIRQFIKTAITSFSAILRKKRITKSIREMLLYVVFKLEDSIAGNPKDIFVLLCEVTS